MDDRLIVTTYDLKAKYGRSVAANLMTKAQNCLNHKVTTTQMIVPHGSRHGTFDTVLQVLTVDSDLMVEYYESIIDKPQYKHARARMMVNLARWKDMG